MNLLQLPACTALVLISFLSFAQDKVNDDESSSYNKNKPGREEWLRNTNSGMFIHFSADAQLGVKIAAAVLLALPVVIAFLFFQKHFVQSMASTGLKD